MRCADDVDVDFVTTGATSRNLCIEPRLFAHRQTSRMLCSTVSMMSSIFPWSACLARLSVNPLSVSKGTWDGRESA